MTAKRQSPPRKGNEEMSGRQREIISVDVSKLIRPATSVFASRCAAVDRHLVYEFDFFDFQEESDLRSPVARVMFPVDSLIDHFWRNSRDFGLQCRHLLDEAGIPPEPIGQKAGLVRSDVVVSSNLSSMYRAGVESIIDFYYISPRDIHFARLQAKKPEIQGVLRVQLPLTVLVGILDHVDSVIQALRDRLGTFSPQR